MQGAAHRIARTVEGTALEPRLVVLGSPFFERRAKDLAAVELSEPIARGLAGLLASNGDAARYLSIRGPLLTRLSQADGASLDDPVERLRSAVPRLEGDLEEFLDALRLFRRDETMFAAVLDLAGLVPFEKMSSFLSVLAEVVIESCLGAARETRADPSASSLAVLGMGKLAGRELTYHSDLDLIFLLEGDAAGILNASRTSQRLIHYLSTPTGAGTAYAVDTRLRPSGGQGMLVTTFEAYRSYQLEQAQTWEHLALMQSRAIGGNRSHAESLLGLIHREVRARGVRPWQVVADLRARIRAERTSESGGQIPFKTGAGGLMDVGFLATGAQLERGARGEPPALPSVPAMLLGAIRGPGVDRVLEAYRLLRRVEARTRWVAGRATENLRTSAETIGVVAELLRPGLTPAALMEEIRAMRKRVREGCERVMRADSIEALAS